MGTLAQVNVDELRAGLERKKQERELLFTPGAFESYYRDRYDRWDNLSAEIRQIEVAIVERGGSI